MGKQKPEGRKLKVVTNKQWLAEGRKRAGMWKKLLRSGPVPLSALPECTMVCEDRRYRVLVTFAAPKRTHPMSFDRCFASEIGRDFSDGGGTAFEKKRGGGFTAANRDLDFFFAKKGDAMSAARRFNDVLFSHRLKGEVEVFDEAWDPSRKLEVKKRPQTE